MAVKKSSSTITAPSTLYSVFDAVDAIKERAKELFMSFVSESRQDRVAMNKFFSAASFPRFQFNKKKIIRVAVPVILVAFFALIAFALIKKATGVAVEGVVTSDVNSIKTTTINREFKFPLKDSSGKKVGEFAYTIKSAELRHQIVVKGQKATSVMGRVFLIINLQIANSLNQGLQINTRDYLRISVGGNEKEWFAPDIHNDPVEAQAISTTNTRLGLAINDSDHDIKIQVGEIDGKKEIIPVSFK